MVFLSPLALFGLGAAVVPPLLHFFQRREPPVVAFPAVRYLQETKRDAQRTVQLQHLLLMLLRILAVVLIVLAAARPVVTGGVGAHHEPTALVIVFDHSLSSGAVQAGTRVLDDLAARARETLREAQDGDAVWLIGADGIARRGTPADLLVEVSRLAPDARRLDLDAAVRQGARLIATSGYARGEIHVLSDLQRSALQSTGNSQQSTTGERCAPPGVDCRLSAVDSSLGGLPILVYHPRGDPPPNRGAVLARPTPSLWLPGGGSVRVGVGGGPAGAAARTTVTLAIDARSLARALVTGGGEVELNAPALAPGWHAGTVSLDADELRADDRRAFAVRVVVPAAVSFGSAAEIGSFAQEALGVLAAAGRVRLGAGDVRIGTSPAGGGAVVVVPPADPSVFGATNRALEAAGVPWRFGARREREDTLDAPAVPELAGVRVRLRWQLEPVGGAERPGDVLARAGGDAWLVRSGRVVLLGSRLVPDETTLPLTGAFLPFVGALVNRIARGESGVIEAMPGDPVALGDRVTAIASADSVMSVRPGAVVTAPAAPGVYALRAGGDTIGMLVVGADPRESDLARAADAEVAALWRGARVSVTDNANAYTARRFRGAGRSELTGPLLLVALVVLIAEAFLAAGGRLKRT